MPSDDLILNADSANATAAIKKLIDQNNALTRSMEQASKAAEKGAAIAAKAFAQQTAAMKGQEKEIENLKKKLEELKENTEDIGSISTAVWTQVGNTIYGHVKSGVQLAIGELNTYVTELDSILVKQDKVARKAMVQSKLGEKEYREVLKTQLAPVVMETGASIDDVQEVFRELVSEGMSREEALNGGVLAILRGAKATGEQMPTDYAVGSMGLLKAYGKDLSAKELERLNVQTAALFDPTNLKSSDMQVLARGAGVYKSAGVDDPTALAAFALLKNEIVPDRNPQMAQTNLEGILKNMATFRGNREKTLRVNQLSDQSGIDDLAEKIDLQGESLPQALKTLNTALSGFDEVSKMTFATELIGKDFAPAFLSMMQNFEKIQQYEALQRNTAPYEQGYAIGREGIEAATNRAEAQRLLALQDEQAVKTKNEQTMKVFDAVEKEHGYSTAYRTWNRFWRNSEQYWNPTQDITLNRRREGTSSAAFVGAGGGAVPQGLIGSGDYVSDVDAEVIERMKEITKPDAVKFDLPNIPITDKVAPPVAPPQSLKRFDFGKELKTPDELAKEKLEMEIDTAQQKVDAARIKAREPSSERAEKISKGEEKSIELLEQVVRVLNLQLDTQKAEVKKKNVKARSTNSQGGDR